MTTLENKVIIIAGGAGGIGSATALLLARHGALVVIASRRIEPTDPLMQEIKVLSPRSSSFRGDLSRPEIWQELVGFVEHRYEAIHGLVNCVGTLNVKNLESLSGSEIESAIRANFSSVIFGAQALLPIMRRQKQGAIVTIGSLGGIVPMPFASLYCATKHAVRGFSLSLSEELKGTGVDASLLSLGPVHTRMLDAEAGSDQSIIAFINKPREPVRVAESIVSLLQRPRREMIIPSATGALSIMCGLAPGLFNICYRILRQVGIIRLHSYRRKHSIPTQHLNWENYNVRTS
jgi:short-subunit dehydrogenase